MSGIIKLPIGLSDPDGLVPVVADYRALLPSIASMLSWHSARKEFCDIDGSGRVSRLVDRSGNGRHFIQATDTQRPAYVANQLGGWGALQFDGVNDVMAWDGVVPTTAFTRMIVMKQAAALGAVGVVLGNINVGAKSSIYIASAGTDLRVRNEFNNGTSLTAAKDGAAFGAYHLVIGSFKGSVGVVRTKVDSAPPVVATNVAVTSVAANTYYMGAGSSGGSSPWPGYIADVAMFNVDLLDGSHDTDLQKMLDYYEGAYGLIS